MTNKPDGPFVLPGLVQWLRVGDRRARQLTLEVARELRVQEIMLLFSWADIYDDHIPGSWGASSLEWLDETIDLFAHTYGMTIYPRLFYTPPCACAERARELGLPPQTNLPPDRLTGFAAFCARMLQRYSGSTGSYWQIGNEPNNDAYWSQKADPDGALFAKMARPAIDVIHAYGKKVVLGGIIPPYQPWLRDMKREGVLPRVDAIGIHAFPGTWDKMEWKGWTHAIATARAFLDHPRQEIWVTEAGFSTAPLHGAHDREARFALEKKQIDFFEDFCRASADKKFWYCAVNQDPEHETDNALNQGKPPDPRAYHFGITLLSGTHKLLFYRWKVLAEMKASTVAHRHEASGKRSA